jgi:hypothetical protein
VAQQPRTTATESDGTMSSESDGGNSEGDAGERVVVLLFLVVRMWWLRVRVGKRIGKQRIEW